ncbi:MAG: serine/threonine protein kinase [Planctomycetaceae bacterium]|nr:serine/threonine protein kinase [Planctomycetaceae bacterium]
MSIRQNKIPIRDLERIDDLCAEFEQQWQNSEPLSIESLIQAESEPHAREALLAELIALEVDYRRRRGESPKRQEYRERFAADAPVVDAAFGESEGSKSAFELPTLQRLAELFPALEINELVGAGGMGAVYRAKQKGLDRVVALKILPEELSQDVKFALRFTREARTLAKLNHPNIVALYEFGTASDIYYFLMEFVEGTTLRDVVAGGNLAPTHALAIVPHLCDALQYAHDQGVIHRDIKPENVLISADGSVKIADFGLSRLLGNGESQHVLTATHQILGTPRYMAPEQLEGTHNVDHRADIYSLGVVIYEMLTGELPIGRFAVPSKKVQIDVRLDEVVLRTLEKEPQRRYQRASQLKSEVQSITSSGDTAYARTVINDGAGKDHAKDIEQAPVPVTATVQDQALAAQLLVTRRQLMDGVRDSLRPLFRGQLIQIVIGIAFIGLAVQCYIRSTHIPHRIVCGIIVHVYGLLTIVHAGLVCGGIKGVDYSKSVREIRGSIEKVQSQYLRTGVLMGFAWWLMWLPVCVTLGVDLVILHAPTRNVSLLTGLIGLVVSLWWYRRALRPEGSWKHRLSGESIAAALRGLDEIESASID